MDKKLLILNWTLEKFWNYTIKTAFRDLSRVDKKWIELEQNFIQWGKFTSGDDNWEYAGRKFFLR
jgi:hypothetical protein